MMNILKNECVLLFTFLTYKTEQIAMGNTDTIGTAVLPISLAVIFGSMAFYIIRSLK